jgi:hypothetical protein
MVKYNKSAYIPKNRHKCINKNPIICRSSWERSFCYWCDSRDKVIKWGSEVIKVPYFDPVKEKVRIYYPDFFLEMNETKYLIEIKPNRELSKPRKSKNKKRSTIIYETRLYATNQAKWRYAMKFCEKREWKFKVITEKTFNFFAF